MRIPPFLEKPSAHVVLIALLGLLAYSNTFDVPFQWDDKELIKDNPIVKDLSYFFTPSEAKGHVQYGIFLRRYISFLSFALNYRIHGLEVTGYHIFNLSIHILNALLVYVLVLFTFRTPFFKNYSYPGHKLIAFFTGLLFVSHPVQTEAVTYIMQRFASLVTFFYLLSMVLYIRWRLGISNAEKKKFGSQALYIMCLVSAVFAIKTKETSLTLPIVIALFEFLFFDGPIKFRAFRLIPLFLLLIIFPLGLAETGMPVGKLLFGVGSEEPLHISKSSYDKFYLQPSYSRWEYLITQFRVIITYLRLLALPKNQTIDYDYPLYDSLSDPNVYLSLLFHGLFLSSAVYACRLSTKYPLLRPLAYGIFWFYLTLSVESSIMPIPMIIAEYRLYLPSVGIFFTLLTGGNLLINKFGHRAKIALTLSFAMLPLVFSAATFMRNDIWRSEISLWEDVVNKSPANARGHLNLAVAFSSSGLIDEAIEHYTIALKLHPEYAAAHNNLGSIYLSKGLPDKAVQHYQTAIRLNPDFAEAHFNLGVIYLDRGTMEQARREFEAALQINPDYYKARLFLDHIAGANAPLPR